jgi:hypothetical protein
MNADNDGALALFLVAGVFIAFDCSCNLLLRVQLAPYPNNLSEADQKAN